MLLLDDKVMEGKNIDMPPPANRGFDGDNKKPTSMVSDLNDLCILNIIINS